MKRVALPYRQGMKTLLLVVVLMIVGGQRAHACDSGGSKSLSSTAIAFGALYAGTTLAFGIGDLAVRDHSENYAGAEVAFNGLAALAWGAYGTLGKASDGWRFAAAG